MSDTDFLNRVKAGIPVTGNYHDATLMGKMLAVKEYLKNAGINDAQMESNLGVATITIGVQDLWNLAPGEVKFSEAFRLFMVPQLQAVSIDV